MLNSEIKEKYAIKEKNYLLLYSYFRGRQVWLMKMNGRGKEREVVMQVEDKKTKNSLS